MAYADVVVAQSDATLAAKITLSLRRKAYLRVVAVLDAEDQRERNVCARMFADAAPAGWVSMVLLALDLTGTLVTATDAQINSAVDLVWDRVKVAG